MRRLIQVAFLSGFIVSFVGCSDTFGPVNSLYETTIDSDQDSKDDQADPVAPPDTPSEELETLPENPEAPPSVDPSPPPTVDHLPAGLGWHQLANTKLSEVCPPDPASFSYPGNCGNVISAWGGATADTSRQRLIIWGGGHNDYYGNELYALDLMDLKMKRLSDPTPLSAPPSCSTIQLADGKPNGRHTYDGLSYIKHLDQMFVFGGGPSCLAGGLSKDTWTLQLESLEWTLRGNPAPGTSNGYAIIPATHYDPVTKLVYAIDSSRGFHAYSSEENQYTALNTTDPQGGYHFTAVIDPQRRLFVAIGGGEAIAYDISDGSDHKLVNWAPLLSGCEKIVSAVYPGLTYDSQMEVFVGWAGGSEVYLLNPDTLSCEKIEFPSGPGAQQSTGTNGRFNYFPDLGIHVLVNDYMEDAYILRLTEQE